MRAVMADSLIIEGQRIRLCSYIMLHNKPCPWRLFLSSALNNCLSTWHISPFTWYLITMAIKYPWLMSHNHGWHRYHGFQIFNNRHGYERSITVLRCRLHLQPWFRSSHRYLTITMNNKKNMVMRCQPQLQTLWFGYLMAMVMSWISMTGLWNILSFFYHGIDKCFLPNK